MRPNKPNGDLSSRNVPGFFNDYFDSSLLKQARVKHFFESSSKQNLIVIDPPNLIYASLPLEAGGSRFVTLKELLLGQQERSIAFLIFLTNNVISRVLAEDVTIHDLRKRWPESLFVCFDYDNHHWYEMSTICAEFSDFYFPAHPGGWGWSELFPSYTGCFIPCGTIQWSRERIIKFIDQEMSEDRSSEPLGLHHFYPSFTYRNRVIKTFSEVYPQVNFTNSSDFHQLTEEEKLASWKSHKVHVIIPVNGDIPIRFFDALITGGLPVVPKELVTSLAYFNIPPNFYVTYAIEDLIRPKEIIDRALSAFHEGGLAMMRDRAAFCLDGFHVSVLVKKAQENVVRSTRLAIDIE